MENKGGVSNNSFLFGVLVGIVLGVVGFVVFSGFTQQEELASISEGFEVNQEIEDDEQSPASIEFNDSPEEHARGGNLGAPVVIVEFSDFQCSYCSNFHSTMKQVIANYPTEVRWVYRHFPLDSIHVYARKAAEASECADQQDRFWEYADALYAQQSEINIPFLSDLAKRLGLNMDKFNRCLNSGEFTAKVEENYQEGLKIGVRGTPGGLINGQPLDGAFPYEDLKPIIDGLLNK